MATPMENVIIALSKFGAFQFLFPFILTSAVFYGLLRKSKIFGEPKKNVIVNATVAVVAAFMVWEYPIISGVDIETQLSTFFFYGTMSILTIMISLMLLGMFFSRGVGEQLSEYLKGKALAGSLIMVLLIGAIIFFTSGITNFTISSVGIAGEDAMSMIVVLGILALLILLVVWPSGETRERTTS